VLPAKRGHLLAGHGVTDQNRTWNAEAVDCSQYVVRESLVVVPVLRLAGGPEPSTSNAEDMTQRRELRSEFVEHMSTIAGAGQQYDGSATATPIEYFKANAWLNSDEPDCVRRGSTNGSMED